MTHPITTNRIVRLFGYLFIGLSLSLQNLPFHSILSSVPHLTQVLGSCVFGPRRAPVRFSHRGTKGPYTILSPAKSKFYYTIRIGWPITPTGRGHPPIVRRWDRRTHPTQEGKGPTRGAREDGRMHVAAAITFGRKSRLKVLMACPCPCPGSAVAPLPR